MEEDLKSGVLDNVHQALLRCFKRLAEENGGTLAKPEIQSPEPRKTRSAASREQKQALIPVVIPEEAEDIL